MDLIPKPDQVVSAASNVAHMMLYGGRERTEKEFSALLADSGFSLKRVIPTPFPAFILESEPA